MNAVLKPTPSGSAKIWTHRKLPRVVARGLTGVAGMRVIFINRYFHPDISATSQMLDDLTRRLVREGIEVHVVCSRQLYNYAAAKLAAEDTVAGVQVHRVNTTRFGRARLLGRAFDYLSFYLTATLKLLELVRQGDVLVAKTDPPLISVPAAAVAMWRDAILINWLQDLFPEVVEHLQGSRMPGWLQRYLCRLRDRSLRVAASNVVIGERMKELLLARGVAAEKVQVIENWADGEFVNPLPVEHSALRTRLGLQGKFVIGYSGNLGRAHEFETLLQAAIYLRYETEVVFLMIGGGARMQQLKAAVEQQLLNNFLFLPYQPRKMLADSMAAADVHLACLQPALEGLIVPSKVYGVLAAGRPCIFIGDRDGEVARILRRHGCGHAVTMGDADALLSALWHLKLDVGYRQRLGQRAATVFVERYTADSGADRWLRVLAEVKASTLQGTVTTAAV